MRGLRRNKSRVLFIAVALVALAMIVAPMLVRRVVRWRLQSMIAAQLNADLQMGDLSYQYPYGVEVTDATLIANGPDGRPLELLRVPHLSLMLAHSPLRSGPLVIESLSIDKPAIHLIRLPAGLVGRNGLAKSKAEKEEETHPWKLSDMFQLRQVTITGGSVIFEDRALANTRPLVWNNLNIDLRTAPTSGSEYGFHFIADDLPLASLDAKGSVDIDSFLLNLERLQLAVNVDPSKRDSAVPPEYQRIIDKFGIRGGLSMTTRAALAPSDLSHSTYDTTVELRDATARVPKWNLNLDHVSGKLHLADDAGHPLAEFVSLDGRSPDAALHLGGGILKFDPQRKHWTLTDLAGNITARPAAPGKTTGSVDFHLTGDGPLTASNLAPLSATLHILPRDMSFQPPGLANRIEQIAETELTLKDGVISARKLRAGYGDDVWYIKQADIDLSRMPESIGIHDLDGAITFAAARSTYPKPLEEMLAPLDPSGPWFFNATATLGLKRSAKPDYHVQLHTARGGLKLTDRRVPVFNINTAIQITPAGIEIQHLEAGALRGELKLAGTIGFGDIPSYQMTGEIRGANLNDVSRLMAKPGEKPAPLAGRANLSLHVAGTISKEQSQVIDAIRGDGELEVKDGDFWQIPVMKSIAANSNVRTVMTVGEAAAVFTVSHGAVHLKHAAVSAPALGVEGHGDVTFKGSLDIDCITTVLGNWSEKFAAGEDVSRTVDQVQRTLNGVTQAAVMNVHVGGSVNHPAVNAIPAPFLSAPMTQFVTFLKGGSQQAGGLLGYVKDQPAPGHN